MSAWMLPVAQTTGSVIGGIVGQQSANSANASEAHKQRMWQDAMSGSAYQRQVRDLKLAGLNPILGMGGNGATTPGGAQATHQNVMPDIAGIASTFNQMKIANAKQGAEIGLLNAQKDNAAAAADKAKTERMLLEREIPGADVKKNIYETIRPFTERISGGAKAMDEIVKKGTDASTKRDLDQWNRMKDAQKSIQLRAK